MTTFNKLRVLSTLLSLLLGSATYAAKAPLNKQDVKSNDDKEEKVAKIEKAENAGRVINTIVDKNDLVNFDFSKTNDFADGEIVVVHRRDTTIRYAKVQLDYFTVSFGNDDKEPNYFHIDAIDRFLNGDKSNKIGQEKKSPRAFGIQLNKAALNRRPAADDLVIVQIDDKWRCGKIENQIVLLVENDKDSIYKGAPKNLIGKLVMRTIGQNANANDIKSASFNEKNNFADGEIVIIPRGAQNVLKYGKVCLNWYRISLDKDGKNYDYYPANKFGKVYGKKNPLPNKDTIPGTITQDSPLLMARIEEKPAPGYMVMVPVEGAENLWVFGKICDGIVIQVEENAHKSASAKAIGKLPANKQ